MEESSVDSASPEATAALSRCDSGLSRANSMGSVASVGPALDADIPWASGVLEEEAKCECCGLMEECTPFYIQRVRDVHCGIFVCGLCAEAVNEEWHRSGQTLLIEEALKSHVSMCAQFNSPERANPAFQLATAMATMRQILMRRIVGSPDEQKPKAWASRHSRSTSCIPVIRHSLQRTDPTN